MAEYYPNIANTNWTIEEKLKCIAILQTAPKEDVEEALQIAHMIVQAIKDGEVTKEFVIDLLQKKMEMDAAYDEGNLFSSLQ